jgi:hypothetical protein
MVCSRAALMPDYRKAHLNDPERIPLDHGAWRPIRRPLAITGFAVNAYSAEAGLSLIEPHDGPPGAALATIAPRGCSPDPRHGVQREVSATGLT